MPCVWTSTILNNLIDTIKSSNSQEITWFDLVVRKVNKMRSSFFPSESSSGLNEINVKLLLVFWWLSSKEWNFGWSTQSSQKYFNCLQNIRKPMFKWVTQSKNMNTPSLNIVVLNRVHIFPGKLQMFSECKTMNVNFSRSTYNISFSTKLFSSVLSKDLYCHCINVIEFFIYKTHKDLLKAIIFVVNQCFSLMIWFVTNVSYIYCSEFEKLWFIPFAAL